MSDYDDDMLHGGFGARIPFPEPEAKIDPSQHLQHLTQAWINERAAPDLLQYEEESVATLLARIEEQVLSTFQDKDP